jgi:hypothetical protein
VAGVRSVGQDTAENSYDVHTSVAVVPEKSTRYPTGVAAEITIGMASAGHKFYRRPSIATVFGPYSGFLEPDFKHNRGDMIFHFLSSAVCRASKITVGPTAVGHGSKTLAVSAPDRTHVVCPHICAASYVRISPCKARA